MILAAFSYGSVVVEYFPDDEVVSLGRNSGDEPAAVLFDKLLKVLASYVFKDTTDDKVSATQLACALGLLL